MKSFISVAVVILMLLAGPVAHAQDYVVRTSWITTEAHGRVPYVTIYKATRVVWEGEGYVISQKSGFLTTLELDFNSEGFLTWTTFKYQWRGNRYVPVN